MTAFAELKSLENLVLFWGLFKGVPICFCLSHLKCYLSSIFFDHKMLWFTNGYRKHGIFTKYEL